MATAKKLPSGNYRVRVFSHVDHSGKKVYESFTAPSKREAELMAAEFKNNKRVVLDDNKTVYDAVTGYIKAKEGVLSPSTVRGYNRMVKYYKPIEHLKITQLTNEKVQLLISDLSKRLSPKTVINIYGLLSSSIGLYSPNTKLRVTLPAKTPSNNTAPSDEDVQRLFEAADGQLKVCIALAAYGSMRRSEISPLTYSDISENIISINKSMVKDNNGEWQIKIPKTSDSFRYAPVPMEIIELIGTGAPDELVVKWKPDTITKRFIDLRTQQNVNIRFHDLRHYYASIGAALGIPDLYMADFGGWKQNSKVLKSVYQNKITPISKKFADKLNGHFSNIINGKNKHTG